MTTKVLVIASLLFVYLINTNFVEGQRNRTRKNFFLPSGEANFFQAYLNCKQGGMELASINSKKDADDLVYFLKDVDKPGNPLGGFWLSGTNLADVNSTQFYWLTGGQRAIYTNWLPNEPNDVYGKENCIEWVEVAGNSGWNDYDCQSTIRYICQYPDECYYCNKHKCQIY